MARMHPGSVGHRRLVLVAHHRPARSPPCWRASLALRQTDLKQALAYTTLMALGTLTLLLGQSTGYAITAFATFLIVHALYKAALFLLVANIDHGTGTRDATLLGGLGRAMPFNGAGRDGCRPCPWRVFRPFLGFIGQGTDVRGRRECADLAPTSSARRSSLPTP